MSFMNSAFMQRFVNPKTLPATIAAAGALILFPGFYDAGAWPIDPHHATYSLDTSWRLALSKLYSAKLNWGQDIVFTYGPLAFLCTRLGIGLSKYTLLIFDLFIAFNFFMVFYHGMAKSQNKGLTFLLIAASVFILPGYLGSGTSILMLAMQIFWLNRALETKTYLSNLMVVFHAVLLFFIKFNTGLIGLVFASGFCIYNLFLRNNPKLFYLLFLALPYALILIVSYPLQVSLGLYLKGGLSIVSGYNEVMFLREKYPAELFFAFIVLVLSLLAFIPASLTDRSQTLKKLYAAFAFFLFGFVLYKQGFTRNDIEHISEFYCYFIFLVLCSSNLHITLQNKRSRALVTAIVFIVIFFAKKRDDKLLDNVLEKFDKKDYISRLENFTDSSGIYYFENSSAIPARIKQKVGQLGIDAYPWNIQALYENRLNYKGRPVFQSYSAYTPYLQKMNYDLYYSPKAPEFVMYEYESIDARYPLFEEPRLQVKFLKDYSCVDTFYYGNRLMLLLQKKKTPEKGTYFKKTKEYELDLANGIIPQKDTYYEVYLEPRLSATLISLLWRSPEIKLQVNTADGNWYEHKTSKGLLECGVFSEYYVGSTLEFLNVMNTDTLNAGKRVKLYKFTPLNKARFNSKAKIIEYKIIR